MNSKPVLRFLGALAANASGYRRRSTRAPRLEFRVYAAPWGEGPEPPEGGTPNGISVRMRPVARSLFVNRPG